MYMHNKQVLSHRLVLSLPHGKNASNQFLNLQMIEHACVRVSIVQSCDDFTSDFKIIYEIKN